MFRIVHLSDLHLAEGFEQSEVITALVADIESISADRRPDAIVFSGDAAAKGSMTQRNIEKLLAQFVSLLRSVVGEEIPFVICPGNHDVDLKNRSPIYSPIFSNVDSPEKASTLVKEACSSGPSPIWAHLDGFRKFASAVDSSAFATNPLYYTTVIRRDGLSIGFASLNSAWMTRGGGRGDYGNLYVGEYAVDAARKELEGADFKIAVMHHPLDWLAPEEKSQIQRHSP